MEDSEKTRSVKSEKIISKKTNACTYCFKIIHHSNDNICIELVINVSQIKYAKEFTSEEIRNFTLQCGYHMSPKTFYDMIISALDSSDDSLEISFEQVDSDDGRKIEGISEFIMNIHYGPKNNFDEYMKIFPVKLNYIKQNEIERIELMILDSNKSREEIWTIIGTINENLKLHKQQSEKSQGDIERIELIVEKFNESIKKIECTPNNVISTNTVDKHYSDIESLITCQKLNDKQIEKMIDFQDNLTVEFDKRICFMEDNIIEILKWKNINNDESLCQTQKIDELKREIESGKSNNESQQIKKIENDMEKIKLTLDVYSESHKKIEKSIWELYDMKNDMENDIKIIEMIMQNYDKSFQNYEQEIDNKICSINNRITCIESIDSSSAQKQQYDSHCAQNHSNKEISKFIEEINKSKEDFKNREDNMKRIELKVSEHSKKFNCNKIFNKLEKQIESINNNIKKIEETWSSLDSENENIKKYQQILQDDISFVKDKVLGTKTNSPTHNTFEFMKQFPNQENSYYQTEPFKFLQLNPQSTTSTTPIYKISPDSISRKKL
jgi:DNA repair exonuclease SbcCD ATPase subunit